MPKNLQQVVPAILPPLDPDFRPPALAHRHFRQRLQEAGGGVPLVIALERTDGSVSLHETSVFPPGHAHAEENLPYAERIFKFLLWQKGGARAYVSGPRQVGEYIRSCYSPDGNRSFDCRFMGDHVYQTPFSVILCRPDEMPAEREIGRSLGRHLEGCRIGFDLGASDRKVAAVIDGRNVFCEEIVWDPKKQSDPGYHFREIVSGLEKAAAHLPRLDAIGGSSAGIFIDNQVRVSSLFRGVPPERYAEVRSLFSRIRERFMVPLEVINDGEVTALAGSMSIQDTEVLGIALGSSQAAGYVNSEGNITGWLNELAFAPVDYNPSAPIEEWSGDRGCGALYFSQQCVFRLAPKANISLGEKMPAADKLRHIQELLEKGDEGALQIWDTMGIYLGYTLALYAEFYSLKHLLLLGRCTSGVGGERLVNQALSVLQSEFAEIARSVRIQIPNERNRRIGQAVAAASLPEIGFKETV